MVLVCFLIVKSAFPLLLLLSFVFPFFRRWYQINTRHHTLQRGLLYLLNLNIKLLTFVSCLFYYIHSCLWRASILSFLRLLGATFCTFQFLFSLAGNFFLIGIRGFNYVIFFSSFIVTLFFLLPASDCPPSTPPLGCSFEFPASCFLRLPLIKVEFIREDCILEN